MRNILILAMALVMALSLGVNYDADGGLLRCNTRRCTPRTPRIAKPEEVPFPELPGEIPSEIPSVAPACPDVCPGGICEVPVIVDVVPSDPVDIDAIVAAVLAKLPPVKMEIEHPDGTVYRQSKPLGEPIRLRLVPQ